MRKGKGESGSQGDPHHSPAVGARFARRRERHQLLPDPLLHRTKDTQANSELTGSLAGARRLLAAAILATDIP